MKIAILMMQKNESELLEKWLRYHGYLVGFQNLFVYDNGSADEAVRETLDSYAKLGVNVDYSKDQKSDFEGKGRLFLEKIKELESREEFDFYIPLDCDEFLGFLDNEGNPSCDMDGFKQVLSEYVGRPELLLIDSQFYNSTVSDKWFIKKPYRKCFFFKNTISDLDVGFHWGKVKNSRDEIRTRIAHFHFHNKPFEIGKMHAKEKLKNRVKDFELSTLQKYSGAGLHLIRFFTQDEKNYISSQLNQKHIHTNSLSEKFLELKVMWPYHAEMLTAISNNEIDIEAKFKENEIQYFHGSIDFLGLDPTTNKLELKGWAMFQLSQPASLIYVVVDDSELVPINITNRYPREDVAGRLGANKTLIGFEAEADPIPSYKNGKLTILAMSSYKAEYFELDVNKKYRGILGD